ncbi:MAG: hypothetical protein AAGA93_10130 [Actinomycetota bacterium]
MLVKPPLYGLAISFDRRPEPIDPTDEVERVDEAIVLDPYASVIVGAGLSTVDGDEYYEGPERRILSLLDQRFAVLEPGIITTWNGSILDLPLLGARARALDIGLGLRICPDRRRNLRLVGRTDPAPARRPAFQIGRTPTGGTRPVSGAWHHQRHLDLRWVYGDVTEADEATSPDPCRGAHLARALAERRWNRARRHLDRMPPAAPLTSYAWACLDADADEGPPVEVPESAKRRHPSAGMAVRG